eukprot:CAMPEP_0114240428 /NCGR_PEP_ID=MMETSP0058-20121206/9066_2 /TAXON_ID=36894 /ORGANISM="Pyramimonas parkeae, CCMP726" /LENGTH=50 /DNA_ID=CAMNT_0001352831 /DNA_START=542 /DNA_END=691 /DNA_ORIENTATION=-
MSSRLSYGSWCKGLIFARGPSTAGGGGAGTARAGCPSEDQPADATERGPG